MTLYATGFGASTVLTGRQKNPSWKKSSYNAFWRFLFVNNV